MRSGQLVVYSYNCEHFIYLYIYLSFYQIEGIVNVWQLAEITQMLRKLLQFRAVTSKYIYFIINPI